MYVVTEADATPGTCSQPMPAARSAAISLRTAAERASPTAMRTTRLPSPARRASRGPALVGRVRVEPEPLGVAPAHGEDRLGHAAVKGQGVGGEQQAVGAQREQVGISRPGADDEHAPRRPGIGGFVELGKRKRGGGRDMAGKREVGRSAFEQAGPEPPADDRIAQPPQHAFAHLGGEFAEPAEGGRQQRLDHPPQLHRQHRGVAVGGDGDGNRRAVDDRGRGEIGQMRPVDHIDRHAGSPHPRRNARIARLVAGGDEGQRSTGHVVGGDVVTAFHAVGVGEGGEIEGGSAAISVSFASVRARRRSFCSAASPSPMTSTRRPATA